MARANWEFALVCGSRYINLMSEPSTGGWTLAEEGGSVLAGKLNAEYSAYDTSYGGGTYSQTTRDNMTVTLSVRILKAGTAALARNIHDVYMFLTDVFLHREGHGPTPVYLVRRTDEGYSGTGKDVVLFGRGPLYHEVQSLDALNIGSNAYSIYLLSGTIREASITLTCNAYGTGKPTFLAESTGYVRYNDDGDLSIYSSASNNCPNPSFENTTDFDAGWAAQDSDISAAAEYEHIHSGVQAARISNTGTSAGYYRISTAAWAASGDRWYSGYVYTDGESATASDLSLYYAGASKITTYETDPDHAGWTRMSASITNSSSGAWTLGAWLAAGKTAIIDDFSVYKSPSALIPYFDGDSGPGCVWQGSSASSSASITGGQWRIRAKWDEQAGYETLFYSKGTISLWVNTPWAGNDGIVHVILDTGVNTTTNRIFLNKTSGNELQFVMYGSTAAGLRQLIYAVDSTTWSANTWHCVIATWDKTGPLELWFDGILVDSTVGTGGTWTNLNQVGTYIYLGTNLAVSGLLNGLISDLRIFGPNAIVSPATLYAAGRGKSELASLWTTAIGGTVKNIDDTDRDNHFYITGVTSDGKAPLRLFLRPSAGSFDRAYIGMFPKSSCSDPALNTIEIDGIGKSGGSTVADTTVSGSSYIRITPSASAAIAPAASGTQDSASANVTVVSRTIPLLNKRYRAYGVVRDNASALGIHKVRMALGGSISEIRAGLGDWQTAPIISSSLSGSAWWTLVDLGVFYPYYTPPVYSFYGQDSTMSTCSAGDVDAFFYVWLTSGASGPTFDFDTITFMPADNCGYVDIASYTMVATDTVLIDTITQPHHAGAISSAASTLSYAQYASLNWFGTWPYAIPNKWNYYNMIITNANKYQHASQVVVSGIYQPRYLWIR